MKRCFKCQRIQSLADGFYRHSNMADGYLNKCIQCTRKDVIDNRRKKLDHYRQYDRSRGFRPGPREKIEARRAIKVAIEGGRLERKPCVECGDQRSDAHHPDYKRPLDVVWLCRQHHMALHRKYV